MDTMTLLLYPMTPHLGEELWEMLGHAPSAQKASWPEFDASAAQVEEFEAVFQVNGKLRGKAMVATGIDEESLKKIALADEAVVRFIEGKTVRKVIIVQGRLVNIVVG
jgi:leucyl-tRNA synthetase